MVGNKPAGDGNDGHLGRTVVGLDADVHCEPGWRRNWTRSYSGRGGTVSREIFSEGANTGGAARRRRLRTSVLCGRSRPNTDAESVSGSRIGGNRQSYEATRHKIGGELRQNRPAMSARLGPFLKISNEERCPASKG